MTRILESYVENIAGSTTTSTTSTNAVLTTTHTGEASTQYMAFAFVRVNKNEATTDLRMAFVNTTAGVTYQDPITEVKDITDYLCMMALGQYTAAATPAANTFELRLWNETSGTITWTDAVIFLIKKDAADGIGESTGNTTVQNSPADKISMSLSVASDGRYAIFYAVEAITADTDFPAASARVDIDGADNCIRQLQSKDVTSRLLLHGAFPVDLTAGTRDLDLEILGHGGSLDDVVFSKARLFAIRMSTFDATYDDFMTTADTNDVNDTYEDVPGASLTATLPAVDHLVIASCSCAGNITTTSYLGKFQQSIGGSNSNKITWTQEPYQGADLMPFTVGYNLAATAVEHIWKFQHAPEATAIVSTDDCAIMVFQIEASAGVVSKSLMINQAINAASTY